MDVTNAFWYAVGIIILLLLLQVLAKPLEIGLRVLGSSLIGGLALWVVNLAGDWGGLHVGLNPVSALVVGVLGLPGLLGLGIMSLVLS